MLSFSKLIKGVHIFNAQALLRIDFNKRTKILELERIFRLNFAFLSKNGARYSLRDVATRLKFMTYLSASIDQLKDRRFYDD